LRKAIQRGRLYLLLIPLAALIPVLPLMVHGCSCGHDFDFHILNWLEASRQFSHGKLHPHWAYTPAFNAGEPRFVFYPPLSWTLGATLGLLLPWAWTPIAYTWLVLTAAGLSLHRLARSFTSPTAALLASVFYLVNPYTLFTAYERTAYAELLAAVWIPLLLHAILRPSEEGGVTIPRIALPVALLWLTNAPAAVMGCYALALLAGIRLIFSQRQRLRLALNAILGTALGLGLAAFYVVPAAYERRFVQIAMAILPGIRIQDNFLFHHIVPDLSDPAALADAALHDAVLRTASVIALVLLASTVVAIAIALRSTTRPGAPYLDSEMWASRKARPHSFPNQQGRGEGRGEGRGAPSFASLAKGGIVDVQASTTRPTLTALTILTIAIAFLLTPISSPIWLHAPELAFLQFPWRVLAILAAALSLALAIALTQLRLTPRATIASALAIAVTFGFPAYTLFRQGCDPEDTVAARVALFYSNAGAEPTDEYTPVTADNDSLAHANPPYWLSSDPDTPAPTISQPGPAPQHLSLDSPVPQTLILNLRDYPAWRITLNTAIVISREQRDDGLIDIAIPAGHSDINITYARRRDQTIGATISLISLVCFIFASRRQRRTAETNQATTELPSSHLPSKIDASQR
jgi:hypothetical protein